MNTEVHHEKTKQEVPYEEKTALGKMKDGIKDAASAVKEAVTGEGIKETVYKNEKTHKDADGNIIHEKTHAQRER
uniref:Uncharacterized protein n=1 Tax=Panagrolaimus sp. PS1159 TaxID=55785 RepID=A0AC35FW56_9BILA